MICLVIDIDTNNLVNTIVAQVTDTPPDGCFLVELIDGMYWNNGKLEPIPQEVVNGN